MSKLLLLLMLACTTLAVGTPIAAAAPTDAVAGDVACYSYTWAWGQHDEACLIRADEDRTCIGYLSETPRNGTEHVTCQLTFYRPRTLVEGQSAPAGATPDDVMCYSRTLPWGEHDTLCLIKYNHGGTCIGYTYRVQGNNTLEDSCQYRIYPRLA